MTTDVSKPEGSEIPPEALVITKENFEAMQSNRYYTPSMKGIRFHTDDKGKLLPIPREFLDNLQESLGIFETGFTWWAGDTACAIKDLYGDEALAKFYEKIGLEPTRGTQLMSVSRAFGFPDKIDELRHPDPKVTHRHHSLVQGIKDPAQRMNLLNEASKNQMNSADFYTLVQAFKAGPGAKDKTDEPEFPVFKVAFRVYDPKTDNPEQFLEECFQKLKAEFPVYLDPELRKEREARDQREKMVKNLPEDVQKELLALPMELPEPEFKAKVKEKEGVFKDAGKIDKFVKRLKSEKADDAEIKQMAQELAGKAKEENQSFADFKEAFKKKKADLRKLKGDQEKIEKLVNQIEDVAKRTEIFETVRTQNLFLEQVDAIVKPILADQLLEAEATKIRKEADEKLEKRRTEINQKFSGEKKADNDGPALPKGQKPGAKKKTSSKKGGGKQAATPAAPPEPPAE